MQYLPKISFLAGIFFVALIENNFSSPHFRVNPFTTFIWYLKNWKSCQKKNLPPRIQQRKNLC